MLTVKRTNWKVVAILVYIGVRRLNNEYRTEEETLSYNTVGLQVLKWPKTTKDKSIDKKSKIIYSYADDIVCSVVEIKCLIQDEGRQIMSYGSKHQ